MNIVIKSAPSVRVVFNQKHCHTATTRVPGRSHWTLTFDVDMDTCAASLWIPRLRASVGPRVQEGGIGGSQGALWGSGVQSPVREDGAIPIQAAIAHTPQAQ